MNKSSFNYSLFENKYNFNSKQKPLYLNQKNKFSYFFVVFLIFVLLFLCVIFKPKSSNILKFYYVEISSFDTYNDALNFSNDIKKNDGAGVIFLDSKYRVFASFYTSKKDAETVVENLKSEYEKAQLFTLEFLAFKPRKNFSKSQNNAIKNFTETALELSSDLENLTIDFCTNKTTFSRCQIMLKNNSKKFSESVENLTKSFSQSNALNLSKKHIMSMMSSMDNMLNVDSKQAVQTYRQELVNFTLSFTQLLKYV